MHRVDHFDGAGPPLRPGFGIAGAIRFHSFSLRSDGQRLVFRAILDIRPRCLHGQIRSGHPSTPHAAENEFVKNSSTNQLRQRNDRLLFRSSITYDKE